MTWFLSQRQKNDLREAKEKRENERKSCNRFLRSWGDFRVFYNKKPVKKDDVQSVIEGLLQNFVNGPGEVTVFPLGFNQPKTLGDTCTNQVSGAPKELTELQEQEILWDGYEAAPVGADRARRIDNSLAYLVKYGELPDEAIIGGLIAKIVDIEADNAILRKRYIEHKNKLRAQDFQMAHLSQMLDSLSRRTNNLENKNAMLDAQKEAERMAAANAQKAVGSTKKPAAKRRRR
jgi:hypothetical protein